MSHRYSYSVVIPVLNESENIKQCIDSLKQTDYPWDKIEVIIVDGMSDDGTRDIVEEYNRKDDSIQLYDNPKQTTPYGMNIGFEKCNNEVIVLLSGHSFVSESFFNSIEETFQDHAPDADVVGGRMIPKPRDYFETIVTGALQSKFGSSSTRFQTQEGFVETVNFGAYKRRVITKVGGMNPELTRAQDYEYNRRVREKEFKIYQHPSICVYYRPRSSMKSLAKQYYGSGYWKLRVRKEYNDLPIPPKMIAAIGSSVIASTLIWTLLYPILMVLHGIVFLSYSVILYSSAKRVEKKSEIINKLHLPGIVFVLMIMHISFALGISSKLVDYSL